MVIRKPHVIRRLRSDSDAPYRREASNCPRPKAKPMAYLGALNVFRHYSTKLKARDKSPG